MNTYKINLAVVAASASLASDGFKFAPQIKGDLRTWGAFLDDERAARCIRRGDKKALSDLGLDLGMKGEPLYYAALTALRACVALSKETVAYRPCAWLLEVVNDQALRLAAARVNKAKRELAVFTSLYNEYKKTATLAYNLSLLSGAEVALPMTIEEYFEGNDDYRKAKEALKTATDEDRAANAEAVKKFPAITAMLNQTKPEEGKGK